MSNKKIYTAPELVGAHWRKSSYSGDNSGQCVEVADLIDTSYAGVAVRDSKNPAGPALLLDPQVFAGFIGDVAHGRI
ncbi:hypothetical protein DWB77_00052 [Streptomyces hundungensis]|uniref:DUF397 domain-containing protein n=1 Tax=Streptomyces hundungensis TaxID=1077946 RepID=A0A387H2S0_9ACTN|nr:DUF397 domain-containing protein [Streptomyces hundungensis]AYG77945.1 hypothetical protein DWB77_00052 [Streptomyces hundungensis]